MNRSIYFDYIEDKLSTLAYRINNRGRLNILNLHLHSENFFMYLMNELFGWELENCNAFKQNIEAIDLKDINNRIIAQVSATATKEKIDAALMKDFSDYSGYSFKFISICKDADHLRGKSYTINPENGFSFNPEKDIIDIKSILKTIETTTIDHQKRIFHFIEKELGKEIDLSKLDTNLAHIIEILAAEDWNFPDEKSPLDFYAIDRKIDFNNLNSAKDSINNFKIYYSRLDKIYSEFNKLGANKSLSLHNSINNMYIQTRNTLSDDALYFSVREQVIHRIKNSANYKPIRDEELELCVDILVVDAFIRCKIFKRPVGYNHVIT